MSVRACVRACVRVRVRACVCVRMRVRVHVRVHVVVERRRARITTCTRGMEQISPIAGQHALDYISLPPSRREGAGVCAGDLGCAAETERFGGASNDQMTTSGRLRFFEGLSR